MEKLKSFQGKIRQVGLTGILGVSMALTACSDDDSPSSPAKTPTVTIESPSRGSTVLGTGFRVKVKTSDFTYGKIGDPNQAGTGHLHVYLDKPASSGANYTGVITGGDTVTLAGPIAAGTHYLIVAMQKNDHSPYNVQDSVSFTVAATGPAPEIAILEPKEGATVGSTVTFKISPKNFKVVAPGAVKDGEGHMHYFVDGGAYNALADTTFTLKDLAPGAHRVKITLQKGDHSDLGVEKVVQFTVSDAKVGFTHPKEGATVGSSVTFKLALENFKIAAPGGVVKAGEGHLHYFVDGGTYNALADSVFTLDSLSPGEHTVKVTLQDNSHADLGIEKTVKFTVSASKPNFSITYPKEGETVGPVVTVKLSLKNLKLAAPGDLKDGEGHLHYFVDNGAYNALVDSAFTLTDLAEGEHTVRVTAQDNKHADAGLERVVKFKVSKAKPSFAIVSPAAGATVGSSATLKLSLSNFKIGAPGGALKEGEGHFHYYVDGGAYNLLADSVVTLNNLAAGEHTVRVVMQDNKHADLNVERTVKFTVSASAPSFQIASPADGDTVTSPVTVKLALKNFAIAAPGAVKANEGHFHYYIDNGTYNALADSAFTLNSLPAGPHTIRVTMQKGDHSDYGLEQWIRINVK